jgi:uncharacterized tellurite resistance protein B-like protein
MTLDQLSSDDRMRLMKFVCSFAWADLHVHAKERAFVARMVKKLKLDKKEVKQVEAWLTVPPRAEEVDPAEVPREHRELFLQSTRQIIVADGEIHPEEQSMFELLEELLR